MIKARLLCLCWLALLLFGCTGDELAKYGITRDNAVYLSNGQPETLDPATAHGSAGGIVGHLFSGLVTLDTTLQVQPNLAIGWDVSDDGTSYTFFLHPNARFHDGLPVTAADVKFSWQRALSPATGSDTALTYLGDIVGAKEVAEGDSAELSGVTIINDKTLTVQIDSPKAYFLAKLTYPVSFIVDQHNIADNELTGTPNGSGPFKLLLWEDDKLLVLERNQDYYRPTNNVNHVVYYLGGGLPLSQYEQDEIDLTGLGGDTLARTQDPNDPLTPDVQTNVSLCTRFVGLNHTVPPFNDQRVRQAFSLAIDKERLIEGTFRDNALAATGVLPPGMPGYSNMAGYAFDPAKAQQLLADAGYSNTIQLTYSASGYGDVGGLTTAVIEMWEENLDVEIGVELVEPYRYFDELYVGNVGNFFNFGWCADYADPENFLDVLFHSQSQQNLGRYASAELDGLLEQARSEPNVAQRMAQYRTIEQYLVDDAAYIFVSHGLSSALVKPRLGGYVHTQIGVPQWHLIEIEP